jgi:hypothetical protein
VYTVFIDENSHYQDESERCRLGEFETYEDALAAAKKVVDDFLDSAYRKGMSAKALLDSYKMYGEDPFIVPDRDKESFSAWGYAEQRCRDLCGG